MKGTRQGEAELEKALLFPALRQLHGSNWLLASEAWNAQRSKHPCKNIGILCTFD